MSATQALPNEPVRLASSQQAEDSTPFTVAGPAASPNVLFTVFETPPAQLSASTDALLTTDSFLVDTRTIVYDRPLPAQNGVESAAEAIALRLRKSGIKRVTAVGVGAGCTVLQAFAVKYPAALRRLCLINATARLAPTLGTRIIDRLEKFFPLGLPMRMLTDEYDSRPELHRVRCPVFVVLTPRAGRYVQEQSVYLASHIPNARLLRVSHELYSPQGAMTDECIRTLQSLIDVPVKRPQKGTAEQNT